MQSVQPDHHHEGTSAAAPITTAFHDQHPTPPFTDPIYDQAHEFYRNGFPTSPSRPDIVVAGHEHTMPTNHRAPSAGAAVTSKANPSVRSTSNPTTTATATPTSSTGHGPAKPALTSRIPSGGVRDRINQFNQGGTHVPIPMKSSRAPTTSESRIFSAAPPTVRARETSRRKDAGPRGGSDGRNAPLRRKTSSHSSGSTPSSARRGSGARPPLFGEVMTNGAQSAGYGIPTLVKQRSNIEGSMHKPNAMFAEDRALSDTEEARSPRSPRSPHSPRDLPNRLHRPPTISSLHRRAQSETSGVFNANSEKSTYNAELNHEAPLREPYSPSSPIFTASSSRIPVKARRSSMSNGSPSMPPNPHAWSFSSHSSGATASLRPQSRNLLHKEIPTRSRPSTPPVYRRYEPSPHRSRVPRETMNATIQVPPPLKDSPRLRSSRPRQPVSSASTAASRARAAERVTSPSPTNPTSRGSPTNPTNRRGPAKLKRIPGVVDTNARRRPWQKNISTPTVSTIPKSQPSPRDSPRSAITGDYNHSFTESTPGAWPDSPETPQLHSSTSPHRTSPSHPSTPKNNTIQPPRLGLAVTGLPIATDLDKPSSALTEFEFDGSPVIGYDVTYQGPALLAAMPHEPQAIDASPTDDNHLDRCSSTDECASICDNIEDIRFANGGITPNDCSATDSCAETSDDLDSDREEQSIQIALRNTPVISPTNGNWSLDHSGGASDHSYKPMMPQVEEFPDDASDVACSILPDDSVSVVMASRPIQNPGPTPPPKIPVIEEIPVDESGHTLTSEARSVVNRVFDHYHALQNLSPEMADQFKNEVEAATPSLPKHGDWESQENTRLYLQDILDGPRTPTASRRDEEPIPPSETGTALSSYPFVANPPTEDHLGTAIIYSSSTPFEPPSETDVREPHHRNSASVSTLRPSPGPDGNTSPIATSFPDAAGELLAPATYQPQRSNVHLHDPASILGALPRDETSTLQTSGTIHLGLGLDGLPIAEPTLAVPPMPDYAPPPHPPPPPPATMSETLSQLNGQARSPPSASFYKRNAFSTISQSAYVEPGSYRPEYSSHSQERRQTVAGASVVDSEAAKAVAESSVGSVATVMAPQDSAVDLETQMSAKSKILKDLVERKNILKELCDTEYSYQQDMIILEDIYKSTSTGILNDADRKVLFGNSDQIRLFATKLQDALKQAVSSVYIMPRQNRWNAKRGSFSTSSSATNETSLDSDASLSKDDRIEIDQRTRVGNAFLANMEEIERVYNVYLRNHTAANNKLTELKAEPNVEAWMEECRKMAADLTSAWNLDALLVKPTQRITKYPLILRNLLQVTVKEHPDYADIEKSLLQLEELLHKMNDSKKRAELVDQAMSQNRRRKESDIRLFPQKFVNRRAEKLKQQVGLSNSAIDADYDKLSQRFGGHFFQLQIVMRDVENYIREVQAYVSRYGHFLSASEHFLGFDIQNQHPEEQSHFVIFARTVREVIAVALPEHTAKIRKSVIEPIQTLWQLHENPQQLMRKRKKRVVDYAKWNAMVERGEAPDKKLRDAADQFKAINETLKDELPKLYDLSSKLMKVCLENFIELQKQWQDTWMRKLEPAAREPQITDDYSSDMLALERDYNDNFAYVDERMQTLGVLNGKTLEEASRFLSSTPSLNEEGSSKRPSTVGSSKRTMSVGGEQSPGAPSSKDHHRVSGTFSPPFSPPGSGYVIPDSFSLGSPPATRTRTSSALSSRGPSTPRSMSAQTPGNAFYSSSALHRYTDLPSAPPRLSVDLSSEQLPSPRFAAFHGSVYGQPPEVDRQSRQSQESVLGWHSGIFNSAMPMSESPLDATHPNLMGDEDEDPEVIFVAASLFEFRIDDSRSFVGFPYLQYSMGEIFDVIGQQGELWLARNQDDPDKKHGWIWEKHFARILPDG